MPEKKEHTHYTCILSIVLFRILYIYNMFSRKFNARFERRARIYVKSNRSQSIYVRRYIQTAALLAAAAAAA